MIRTLLCLGLLAGPAWTAPAAWQVSAEGGAQLWLLGSIHYLRSSDYPLPELVDRLYSQADVLVMELDLDDLDVRRVERAVLDVALLPPGRSLRSTLSTETYERTGRRARELGVELALLERFEPWMVALNLMEAGMARLGFEPGRGLEHYLLGKAVRDGKDVLGLETLEAQIAVFDHLSRAQQEALMRQTLQGLESAERAMGELASAWREGRLDALASALRADFADFPELYDALVKRRNVTWLDELERLLADNKRYLIVVGALHLVGPDNVIELLEMRGLDVEQIESQK